ncbi:RNA-binding S4 domain-containing protein [Leuconostoc falkenbergense]|jgi:ribosomal 50S subunit-recycling heat shock protein|uniref:RQC P-site tRNA stabilizing factor n=2 Tax=Leuconostoc TaxID=1243 RepID=A0A9X3INU9_9LACO|nr:MULTISPECIES: RNA-binding S4 domain-containing protein [Leuconostoc]KDA47224.1 Ribosome-associated heat shock protein [Leuconostoc pseudomesenteroides 1159]KDA49540.1 Ribosome-associated heat shock protein [Leuconostoc pseudomesenteroides PS12]CCJ67193.1 S4-domain-containing heat shock protein; S4-domain-containing heat shock protein [Leuconostoc pseudomesenteroides 4882]MCT4377923.1 RNA-binding S4 domain-containing protein [Leuconostoc falkenbergense]MCT4389667.1 RNA-binding S4 domain-cont
MRLDKYLKISRLIKRRTVAKEIADQGRISINGKVAKSSTDVATNDELEIRFGNKTVTVKVVKIVETTKKEESADMYEVLRETYAQDFREIGDEK